MAEEHKQHWVEDEDTLDRYLRDQIDPDERSVFEAHVSSCDKCASLLEQERRLYAGIRSFGRQKKKEELRRALADRTSQKMVTYRWVAAAATIVLAVAIWYIPGEDPVPPALTEEPATEEEVEAPVLKDEDQVPPPVQAESEERRARMSQYESLAASRDAAAGAGAAVEGEGIPEVQAMAPAAAKPILQDSWRLGRQTVRSKVLSAEKKEMREDLAMERMAVEAESDEAGEGLRGLDNVILTQKQFMDADPQMQSLSLVNREAVPVEYTEAGDSIRITLYLQELLPEEDLQKARILVLESDSILVQVGGQEFRISQRPFRITQ